MSTTSLTRTATITLADVKHVLWRIQSDLRVLRVLHGMITEEQERVHLADLTAWVYRGYAETITFWFVTPSYVGRFGVKYELTRQWRGEADDDSGGLEHRDLRGATFLVRVHGTAAWKGLSTVQRRQFYGGLEGTWGPATLVIDTSVGQWASGPTYGSGALGATRSTFQER